MNINYHSLVEGACPTLVSPPFLLHPSIHLRDKRFTAPFCFSFFFSPAMFGVRSHMEREAWNVLASLSPRVFTLTVHISLSIVLYVQLFQIHLTHTQKKHLLPSVCLKSSCSHENVETHLVVSVVPFPPDLSVHSCCGKPEHTLHSSLLANTHGPMWRFQCYNNFNNLSHFIVYHHYIALYCRFWPSIHTVTLQITENSQNIKLLKTPFIINYF